MRDTEQNRTPGIVIVQDSHAITEFLQRTLEAHGYAVAGAFDSSESALAHGQNPAADLLIIDTNVLAAGQALADARRLLTMTGLPVILLGSDDAHASACARELNPQGVLRKPFTQHELLAVVQSAMVNHQSAAMVRQSEMLCQLLTQYSRDVVWVRDLDGRCLFVSPSIEQLTGYSPGEFQALNYESTITRDSLLPHRSAIQRMVQAATSSTAPVAPVRGDITLVHKSGKFLPVRDTVHVQRDSRGDVASVAGIYHDNSEHMELTKSLLQARQRFELTLAATQAAIWDWNILDNEVYFSPACLKLLGYEAGQLAQSWDTWSQIVVPADYAGFVDALSRHMIDPRQAFAHEMRVQHADGSVVWVQLHAQCHTDERGTVGRMVGVLHDITADKALQPVTGLPGDVYFEERLQAAINRHHTDRRSLYAILTIGVDGLGQIAATRGDEVRDALLRQCGALLQQVLASWHKQQSITGTLAATTDGRFRILLESLTDFERVPVLAQRLGQACSGSNQLQGSAVAWTVSSGVFLGIQTVSLARDALRGADSALRVGQMRASRSVEVFNVEMRSEVLQRLRLSSDLAEAIHRGELSVHYQPICYLQNQRFAGFEALLRWQHAQLGPISPVVFIPIAESAGLMGEIGQWVLRESFHQFHTWMQTGLVSPSNFLSVNVSPLQLADPDFVSRVAQILAATGVRAAQVKLEVTESSLMADVNRSRLMLRQLHELGFQLSIDDFGTGYSSLSYLQEFSMDYLKIERMFVSRLTDGTTASDPSTILLRSIIGLGSNLGLQSIAEGIETPHQLAMLGALGCDFGQGYLWARPMPAADATSYLRGLKS